MLERADVPQTSRLFLRCISNDSITSVEHAGTARGQFAMMRGVRQGCRASGYSLTMPFDLVYSWDMFLSCRLHLTDRGSCEDVPVPAPTTLLSPRLFCAMSFRRWQMP